MGTALNDTRKVKDFDKHENDLRHWCFIDLSCGETRLVVKLASVRLGVWSRILIDGYGING